MFFSFSVRACAQRSDAKMEYLGDPKTGMTFGMGPIHEVDAYTKRCIKRCLQGIQTLKIRARFPPKPRPPPQNHPRAPLLTRPPESKSPRAAAWPRRAFSNARDTTPLAARPPRPPNSRPRPHLSTIIPPNPSNPCAPSESFVFKPEPGSSAPENFAARPRTQIFDPSPPEDPRGPSPRRLTRKKNPARASDSGAGRAPRAPEPRPPRPPTKLRGPPRAPKFLQNPPAPRNPAGARPQDPADPRALQESLKTPPAPKVPRPSTKNPACAPKSRPRGPPPGPAPAPRTRFPGPSGLRPDTRHRRVARARRVAGHVAARALRRRRRLRRPSGRSHNERRHGRHHRVRAGAETNVSGEEFLKKN